MYTEAIRYSHYLYFLQSLYQILLSYMCTFLDNEIHIHGRVFMCLVHEGIVSRATFLGGKFEIEAGKKTDALGTICFFQLVFSQNVVY